MGEGAKLGAATVGAIGSEFSRAKRNKDETREARDYKDRVEDTSMRGETTYRHKRSMLQGAIEDFYKQKGWPIPTAGEGAYTTRPLPGDKPLYEGYNVPRASWNYGKIEPQDVAPVPSPFPEPTPQIDIAGGTPSPDVVQGLTDMGITPTVPSSQPTQQSMMAGTQELDPKIEETLRRYGY